MPWRLIAWMMEKVCSTKSGDSPMDGSSMQMSLRAGHQRAADGDHLLLATRQRSRQLAAAFLDAGEQVVDARQVFVELWSAFAGVGAHLQVFDTPSCAGTAGALPAPAPDRGAPGPRWTAARSPGRQT